VVGGVVGRGEEGGRGGAVLTPVVASSPHNPRKKHSITLFFNFCCTDSDGVGLSVVVVASVVVTSVLSYSS